MQADLSLYVSAAIMEEMRTALACLLLTGLLPARTMAPELGNVRTIYLLPMANSLDQYIANRLTRESRFVVSTDPQTADAVMTDRLGEPFEKRMTELYPPAPPPAPPASGKDKDKDKESDTKKDVVKDEPLRMGSFSRGKGTVFLVERATRK